MDDHLLALRSHSPAVIAIGGSAGALDALNQLLPALPATLAAPIVVVLHLPPDRESGMAAVLGAACGLPVLEAEDKIWMSAASIYMAPADYHLLIETDGSLALSADEPVHYSRPSIDVLFQSAAEAFGARVLGILLSGASADGAEGLAAIRARGGLTWVQTPESASVPIMPGAALALGPHAALDPRDMGRTLCQWGSSDD